jgi:hypothetical protein
MATGPTTIATDVEVKYSPDLLEAAANCFTRQYLFHRQGRTLWGACVVNAAGAGAAIAFSAGQPYIAGGVAIAVAGPLYLLYLLTLFPRGRARDMARALPPAAHFSFTDEALEYSAKGKKAQIKWTAIKEVWECPVAFLLVFSVFGVVFGVVPKEGLPGEVTDFLSAKAHEKNGKR